MSSPPLENALGLFLKDRRTKLDPAAFGLTGARRRTPGLRREEVAQRANISATWYTWLEQGRGGAASSAVLDRIAHALLLTEREREHLYLLGLGRPPEVQYQPSQGVTPRLQRLLDAFELSPALVKTPIWDVVAWNRPASLILTDYGALEPCERNILRMIFLNPRVHDAQTNWEAVARFVVGAFRADVARAGAGFEIEPLIAELSAKSVEFRGMWKENDVRGYGEGVKHLRHPVLGLLAFEFSSFAVDGRPDLSMVVYNPATEDDRRLVKTLLDDAPEHRRLKQAQPEPAPAGSDARVVSSRRRSEQLDKARRKAGSPST